MFIGLLTHKQKQLGYFVNQDRDFIYVFHRNDGAPRLIALFDYEIATVKEIRDSATDDIRVLFQKLLTEGLAVEGN